MWSVVRALAALSRRPEAKVEKKMSSKRPGSGFGDRFRGRRPPEWNLRSSTLVVGLVAFKSICVTQVRSVPAEPRHVPRLFDRVSRGCGVCPEFQEAWRSWKPHVLGEICHV